MGRGVLEPQTFWITDILGKIPFDFIGKYEYLFDDFAKVSRILGVSCDLPHEIRGDNSDYRSAYNSQAKDMIWKHYREEIKMFGYAFEN
jgi:hypothetical protein